MIRERGQEVHFEGSKRKGEGEHTICAALAERKTYRLTDALIDASVLKETDDDGGGDEEHTEVFSTSLR